MDALRLISFLHVFIAPIHQGSSDVTSTFNVNGVLTGLLFIGVNCPVENIQLGAIHTMDVNRGDRHSTFSFSYPSFVPVHLALVGAYMSSVLRFVPCYRKVRNT